MLARLAFVAFLWQQLAKISEYAIQLIMLKLTAHYLGPERSGVYAAVGSVLGLALAGIQLGLEESANNFISRAADYPKRVAFLVRALFAKRLLLSLLVGAVIFVAAPLLASANNVNDANYFRILALVLILTATSTLLSYFMLALFENRQVMAVRLLAMVAQVVLLVAFLSRGMDVWGALLAQAIAAGIMLVGFFAFNARHWRVDPEAIPLKPVFSFGFTLGIRNMMDFVLGKAMGIQLLALLGIGLSEIGYYNASFNLRLTIDTFFAAGMGATALVATARLTEKGGAKQLPKAWIYNLKATTLLCVPPMMFFLLHTQAGLAAITSREFIPGTAVCRVLLTLAIVTRVFGGGASGTVLNADGKERLVLRQYIIGGVCNLALDLALIPFFGIYGVAVATGFSSILTSYLGYAAVRSAYAVRFPAAYTVKVVAASAVAAAGTCPFYAYMVPLTSGKVWWLFPAAGVFLLVFLPTLRALRPFDAEDVETARKVGRRIGILVEKFASCSPGATETSA